MSETKTEAKPRAPFKWLIPIQTSKTTTTFGRPELQAACRGSEDMAIQLNYFAYEASSEAQNNKIDIEQVDFIRITRSQDEIMKGILNCVSKKTHIKQMEKFEEWGFIKSDAYHHIYDIYFKKIAEVIANPPPAEKRKPRGRHVSQKVKSTNSEVKTTNCKLEDEIVPDCTFNPNEEMVNLQNQIVKLQFEMVNLQNQIVKLQNLRSYESAPHLALSGFYNDTDSIDYKRLREIGNYVVAHAIDDTPIFSFPVVDSEIQVSDESFKVAVLDDWKVYRPSQKITTSSQALEQILNRFSNQSSSELSTPGTDLSPESVDKSVQTDEETSVPPQASEQSYSRETTQPTTPAQSPDSEESTPPSEKPARPARPRKPKVDMKPVAPPSKPDAATEWSVEKMLAWGDYARGFGHPLSNRSDSKYQKALDASRKAVGRGITENQFLLIFFNWMQGKTIDKQEVPDGTPVSDYWTTSTVDLWNFNDNYQSELKKYRAQKAVQQPTKPPVLEEASKQMIGQAGAMMEAVKAANVQESDFVRKNREMAARYNKKVG